MQTKILISRFRARKKQIQVDNRYGVGDVLHLTMGHIQRRTYALGFQKKVADSTRIPGKKVADSTRIPEKKVAEIPLTPIGFRDSGIPLKKLRILLGFRDSRIPLKKWRILLGFQAKRW